MQTDPIAQPSAPAAARAPLTPFERGQAALANALALAGYAADSDERLQFMCGICGDLLGRDDTLAPPSPLSAIVDHALQVAAAGMAADLVNAKRKAATMEKAFGELAEAIKPILVAHLRGDGNAVYDALVAFVAERCKVIGQSAAGVH